MSKQTCDILVVDSGGFIKNAPLREMASQDVITMREVVDEIRDKETKKRLQVLPYELKMKQPDTEDIQIGKQLVKCDLTNFEIHLLVTNFSKKTGDYSSLSATDIKVIALAYMLEKQVVGSTDHLNTEPKAQPSVNFYKPGQTNSDSQKALPGFVVPKHEADELVSPKNILIYPFA